MIEQERVWKKNYYFAIIDIFLEHKVRRNKMATQFVLIKRRNKMATQFD